MSVYWDIDKDSSKALVGWAKANPQEKFLSPKTGNLPCFYKRVIMNVAPDPLPVSIKVSDQGKYVTFKAQDCEQLSFYEDAKRELEEKTFMYQKARTPMEAAMTTAYFKLQLQYMEDHPEFKIRTRVSFSFRVKDSKIKVTEMPSLETWYGFDPVLSYKMNCEVSKRLTGDRYRPSSFEESLKEQRESEREVFEGQAAKLSEIYFAANAFLYYANNNPKEERLIRGIAKSNQETGDKVIAFRMVKISEDKEELNAIELPENYLEKSEKGVYSVRGHIRYLSSSWYKGSKGKKIWVGAYLKNMPSEYYEEKRKTKQKERKEDASFENPKDWVTDIDLKMDKNKQ